MIRVDTNHSYEGVSTVVMKEENEKWYDQNRLSAIWLCVIVSTNDTVHKFYQ